MTLADEYQKQVVTVLTQLENDLSKAKSEEENLRDLMKQTEKAFQQQRVVQTQRMKTIRKLHEQYMKGMRELDEAHRYSVVSNTELSYLTTYRHYIVKPWYNA